MHYALALLPATHLPTVSLHTKARPRHTHTHTHGLVQLAGFLFLTLFSQIEHVHECTHLCARSHTHTHTHTHTLTQRGLVPLAVTLVLISHTKCTCARMYTPVHTHMTHTYMHTHTHTHTQTGLVPCAVTLGSYFSHCILKACTCARKHLHIVM